MLVPMSGPEDRLDLVPFAHFVLSHGLSLLRYDKQRVGNSTGVTEAPLNCRGRLITGPPCPRGDRKYPELRWFAVS